MGEVLEHDKFLLRLIQLLNSTSGIMLATAFLSDFRLNGLSRADPTSHVGIVVGPSVALVASLWKNE